MDKVVIIRHGESEANRLGILSSMEGAYPLTEIGKQQAEMAGEQLKDLHFDGVISSPVLRTKQTAEIIARFLGLKVKIDRRVGEAGLGDLEGKNFRDMTSSDRWSYHMEPWESNVRRMREAIDSYDGVYVIVSHALPIKAILCYYLSINDEDSCKGVEIRYASISGILINPRRVLSIGSIVLSDRFKKAFQVN